MSAIVLLVSTKANSLTSCGPSHLLPLVRLAFRAETVPRRVRQPQPKELLRSAPQRWSQQRRRRQRPMQPLPSRRPWPCQAPPSPPVQQRIDWLCGRRQNANRMASIRRLSNGQRQAARFAATGNKRALETLMVGSASPTHLAAGSCDLHRHTLSLHSRRRCIRRGLLWRDMLRRQA